MKLADLYVEYRAKGLARLSASMKAFRGRLEATNRAMTRIAATAKRAFLIAGAATAGAVLAAARLEKQLAMVATMLDKTTMPFMRDYEQGLRRLARQYGESTSTLAKGLYDILSASISAAKAMDVLDVATKAAAAGMTSTAVSADAITTILNAYQMSAEKAGEISDKLFATVKRGKLTYEELASSIGKVAATAAIAGVSLDEMLAAIATITRAGIRSDQAMTSVVGTIRSFLKPSDEGIRLARELGFELNITTLQAEGLAGVFAKLTTLNAAQLATIFPNIRGLKGVAAAMQDLAGFTKDTNLMMASFGLTQEAFLKTSNTLSFRLGQLKARFLDLAISVGKRLMPMMETLVKLLVAFSKKAQEIDLASMIAGFLKWTLAISGTIIALKALVAILTILAVHPVIAAITVATLIIGALAIEAGVLDGVVDSLRSKMDELTGSTKEYVNTQKEMVSGLVVQSGEELRSIIRLAELAKVTEKNAEQAVEYQKAITDLKKSFPAMSREVDKLARTGEATPLLGMAKVEQRGRILNTLTKERGMLANQVGEQEKILALRKETRSEIQRAYDESARELGNRIQAEAKAEEFYKKNLPKYYTIAPKIGEAAWLKTKAATQEAGKAQEELRPKLEQTGISVTKLEKRLGGLRSQYKKVADAMKALRKETEREAAVFLERAVLGDLLKDVREEWFPKEMPESQKKLKAQFIRESHAADVKAAQGREQDEQARQKRLQQGRLQGMQKSLSEMTGMATQFAQKMIPSEEQWKRQLEIVKEEFGEESPFFKAMKMQADADKEAKKTAGAGRWVGITQLYKELQSAALRPQRKFNQQALKLWGDMLTAIETQTDEIRKQRAIVGA